MAITAPIPMPKSIGDSFDSGMASSQSMFKQMLENQLQPQRKALMKGQATQAQAAGDYQNIINSYLRGDDNVDNSGPDASRRK